MEGRMSQADDDKAQKARADAIRRARDARNAEIASGGTTSASGGEADDVANSENGAADNAHSSYVDMIDREMRRDQHRDE
jgi:hypothetical protein